MEDDSPWGDVPSAGSPASQNPPKLDDEATPSTPYPPAFAANNLPSAFSSFAEATPAAKAADSTAPSSMSSSVPRGAARKTIKRHGAQPTRLEAVDDSLGPLGPLGDTFQASAAVDEPPIPPQKEQAPRSRPTTSSSQPSLSGMMGSVSLDDNDEEPSSRARVPPPVQPPTNGGPQRQTQPSMSVVEAAKPTFNILVGDPHKVGDLTGSHTEYSVTTKTSSKAYREPEFSVSRRYRDFLWLYNQLHNNNPGVVVPPPPEKQAMNRYDANFIESRRQALERMLNKIAAHPILQIDSDLKLFLESESILIDIKNKERKDPGVGESKGMLSSIGISVGSSGKFIEHDDASPAAPVLPPLYLLTGAQWFHDRKIYLDALETQLKALLKATDTVVTQRRGLAEACSDFSASLASLASVELSPSLSGPLDGLSEIQLRIRDLYERQAQQDVLTLGIVIDEYIRLIGSVKTSFSMRQKSYHNWHAAESELGKRKAMQEKLLRQGKSQQDRLNQLGAEVADAERKVHQARLLFEDMGRLMRAELERFEKEKVEDFKSGVETFLESAVEAQKELIEIWETYLMQLDAEEDGAEFGTAPPPAGVQAVPLKNPGEVEPRPSEDTAQMGSPTLVGSMGDDDEEDD
ncbi:Vps5-domain-containing protein [Aulographum hederae CBS 113979]|uniref:Vps5-domain-containing protein n=1 Tax=Aulographum hederae CBS 113979 TaxID=1176131 RepID=A0A6G1HF24_9PEZI|nr:Vps5-domain-containing protein [Aulographum hederae CBS 113979]